MADDLTPEQFEVLRLISEDGIEADLTDEQRQIAEWLADQDYTHGMGDDYDFDIYLTSAGKDALNQNNPQWWASEYQRRQWKVEQARRIVEDIPGKSERYIAALRKQIENLEKQIAKEMEGSQIYLAQATEDAAQAECDFQEWVEAHKDRFPQV